MDAAGQHEPDGERAASQKSPDAFRTISEVSSDIDVPQHVLRFWEGKFAQIKPLKRGGGRRYYRPEDVDLLRGIQHLLYGDGYTIKGVQKLLRENGVKFVVAAGRREHATAKAAPRPQATAPLAEPTPAVAHPPAPLPETAPAATTSGLGGAPHFRPAAPPPFQTELSLPPTEPAPETEIVAQTAEVIVEATGEDVAGGADPVQDDLADARRIEAAARLLSRLKALRRDYDLRLQAAKNGRS